MYNNKYRSASEPFRHLSAYILNSVLAMTLALPANTAQAADGDARTSRIAASTPAAAPAGAGQIGDKWAVVIGVSRFADGRVPALKYPAKDAKDFADFLMEP